MHSKSLFNSPIVSILAMYTFYLTDSFLCRLRISEKKIHFWNKKWFSAKNMNKKYGIHHQKCFLVRSGLDHMSYKLIDFAFLSKH